MPTKPKQGKRTLKPERNCNVRPEDDPLKRDLGDALIENGKYEEALEIYKKSTDRSVLLNYKVARTILFQGKCKEAEEMLQAIKTPLDEDGNMPGRVRITHAASIVCQIKQSGLSDGDMLKQARTLFKMGFETDKTRWCNILLTGENTKNEGFAKIADILNPSLGAWLSEEACNR